MEDFIITIPTNENPLILQDLQNLAGIYDEFELEIDKPDSDLTIFDCDTKDESGRYSIVAKGLFDGESLDIHW